VGSKQEAAVRPDQLDERRPVNGHDSPFGVNTSFP
jgi:hypothetical protein